MRNRSSVAQARDHQDDQARQTRREKLYASYDEAAQDPVFMSELRAIAEEFDITVGDGLEAEEPYPMGSSA
ncbi:hypothetical protein [Longimicrobium terrae]|uniref:Uncharacterized protein n=1 Tax=Longimicrobium terrae TaxID=1639882 RepID=A0A841GND4_9BACT|nr:hypothetical protein [Longimicrobium terrae]MBB4635753.1 hypothetical protein [Longimicrobium terrae]MBB6070147.1 hypothetical protein [Longimicrobium terrae]NNC33048.1 hypothetical protein [Longimicrobium terrae]